MLYPYTINVTSHYFIIFCLQSNLMKKINKLIILTSILLFSLMAMSSIFTRIFKLPSQLTIDFSQDNGKITHGATGFLYGIAEPNVPNGNVLKGIAPKVLATRVPKGLQHPSGDISQVEDTFFENGGENAVIYMQDIYPEWYYGYRPNYLETMSNVLDDLIACKHSDKFIYQPFNEMDNGVWYGDFSIKENRIKFYQAFNGAYKLIKDKTGGSMVAGPSYCNYNHDYIKEFLEYCIQHDCVPEVMVWHELAWYSTYGLRDSVEDYRKLEKSLGLSERRIILDEYGSMKDIGVPGKMMQYIASFEAKKVDGCLAFWRIPNNLNELAVDNNVPTAMWWLYHWYGQLNGSSYSVTKARHTIDYLSGVASTIDNEATILFAGAEGKTQINLTNLNDLSKFKNAKSLSYTIEYLDFQGLRASCLGPTKHVEGVVQINNGKAKIVIGDLKHTRAYKLIVNPLYQSESERQKVYEPTTRYEAEHFASSKAIVKYDNVQYATSGDAVRLNKSDILTFNVEASQDGNYNINLVYACNNVKAGERVSSNIKVAIDSTCKEYNLPNTLQIGATSSYQIPAFLSKGTHTIKVQTLDDETIIDFIDLIELNLKQDTFKAICLNSENTDDEYIVVVPQSGYYLISSDQTITSLNGEEIYADNGSSIYLQYGINVFQSEKSNKDITFKLDSERCDYIQPQPNEDIKIVKNNNSPTGTYIKDAPIGVMVEFNYTVPIGGKYAITIAYAQPEISGRHDYNVKLVERYAVISVNGKNQSTYYFANTYSNDTFNEITINVELEEGQNTISLVNDGHYKWGDLLPKLPNIAGISVNKIVM